MLELWLQQLHHYIKLRATKWATMKVAAPFISVNTLLSFFSVVGVIVATVVALFAAEIIFGKRILEQIWGSRNGITVRVGFTKLCWYFGVEMCSKIGRAEYRKQ